MMSTLKSMGQSVHSLGIKTLAHPHWAGKTGFAALTLILLAVCAVAVVVLPLMFLLVGMAKNFVAGKEVADADYDACIERQIDATDDHQRLVQQFDE